MNDKLIRKYFTPEIKKEIDAKIARYETKRASILEVLHILQAHYGFISQETEKAVAAYLAIPDIDVHEVVTFYTLFYRKQKAKTRFNVCRTLACTLKGSQDILRQLEEKLGIKPGQMTPDGKFSVQGVECLGACEMAPMMQLNDDEYIGDLTREKLDALIKDAGINM